MKKENRREFLLKLSAMTAAVMAPLPMISCGSSNRDRFGEILPQRLLGSTGESITMLGMGGWHIGYIPEKEAERLIDAAMEAGVRLFDTGEWYQEGGSERTLGKYMVPKYREEVFLFSKTTATDAATARKHLEGSLKRLNTDYLDLWKMHRIMTADEFDEKLRNGVVDEMLKAKEEGLVRHIGFSGHNFSSTNTHVAEVQDALSTCLMPVNVADPSYDSFILNTMPVLQEKNYGIMAMKTLAGGGLMATSGSEGTFDPEKPRVLPERISIEEALHFVWSLPVSTIISGIRTIEELHQNVKAARSFTGMDEAGRTKLIEKVADIASTGGMEWYKGRVS